MEWWTAFQAFILGVVEGLTEFLPISSTGHQIIVADLIGFGGERAKAFNIIIQLAAILAVVWEFRGKIFQVVRDLPSQRQAQRFTANLLIAFFPPVVLGVLFADLIHEWLFNPITVALALVVIRYLRRLDEMARRIHLEALALAFVGTALLTFTYGFLETTGFPKLSMFFVWPLMGAFWVIGCVLGLRRYA